MKRCGVGSMGVLAGVVLCGRVCVGEARAQDWPAWRAAESTLMTPWATAVDPAAVLPEYPRPTMARDEWRSLNGLWEFEEAPAELDTPDCNTFSGTVLVPFAFESSLSGVGRRVEHAWVRRGFEVPESWRGGRVLLHFGAVDWRARVWVNGKFVGAHAGGYDPFSFDITDVLVEGEKQALMVRVFDPSDGGTQPRGKQVREPEGIWYTPSSGIWQSVWIEPVSDRSVERLAIEPDAASSSVAIEALVRGEGEGCELAVRVEREGRVVSEARLAPAQGRVVLPLDRERAVALWSPESPSLYDLRVQVLHDGVVVDEVTSYFGVRTIEVRPDEEGTERIHLNGRPYFVLGPLDQGFWPDGLYTAPTDEALRSDIEATKRLGFNACRKHVKVESERWYWWCDRLGLLVLQDMPSGDAYVAPGEGEISRSTESAGQFELELARMIDARRHHPSIVMWVPFNEGWGQYDTVRIAGLVRALDPTRLVNCASGWNDYPAGDVIDWHVYPGPGSPEPGEGRAAFLGEFGGLGMPVEGHLWKARDNWGYRTFESREALTAAYESLLEQVGVLAGDPGLSGAIYTQTTDVEIEVNGLLTYDRRVVKMDEARVRAANERALRPPPSVRAIAPTSRREAQVWRVTESDPGAGWEARGFDDSAWAERPGGFGAPGTPGSVIGTEWRGGEIWLRREFVLPRMVLQRPMLQVHHDEDAEVYINGVLAARLEGYTTGYVLRELSGEARGALIGGPTVIAVRCRQTTGGQYIDVGLVDVVEHEGD